MPGLDQEHSAWLLLSQLGHLEPSEVETTVRASGWMSRDVWRGQSGGHTEHSLPTLGLGQERAHIPFPRGCCL